MVCMTMHEAILDDAERKNFATIEYSNDPIEF